jgi:hypothetical protein
MTDLAGSEDFDHPWHTPPVHISGKPPYSVFADGFGRQQINAERLS